MDDHVRSGAGAAAVAAAGSQAGAEAGAAADSQAGGEASAAAGSQAGGEAGVRLSLVGRTALVTGASGLGGTIAVRLAEAGAHVVVHARSNRSAVAGVVDRITAAGGRADAVFGDVVDDAEAIVAAAAACAAAGVGDAGAGAAGAAVAGVGGAGVGGAGVGGAGVGGAGFVDVLVNAAAIQPVGALVDLTAADVTELLRVDVVGIAELTRLVAARLIAAGRPGSVVSIASIEGIRPAFGHSHYAAAKAAVLMHTRAAALELGRHAIRVNAVAPGLIERDGLDTSWPDGVARWRAACPLGRVGEPADVADAVLFLASDASRWITGATLVVDGGMLTTPGW